MNSLAIKKKSNHYEEFDREKLVRSLQKSGADEKVCNQVIEAIEPKLFDKKTTSGQLFQLTKRQLYKRSIILAANYHLVRGIYELGPTGYPFEVLCAEMLKKKGFDTQVGVVMKGEFVNHEVDVIAIRKDVKYLCECKFHNRNTGKSSIKVPLYINSRFLDIIGKHGKGSFHNYIIFSNTTFSKDAIRYAEGVGIQLFSMNYPEKNTFVDHIIKYRIYPITCLKSLKRRDVNYLLDKGIVIIQQLKERIELLDKRDLSPKQANAIRHEINILSKMPPYPLMK